MAKVVIPDKICPHCGGNEWYVTHPKDRKIRFICVSEKKKNVRRYVNKEIVAEASKRFRINNPEKSKEYNKKWRNNNKEKYYTNLKKWKKENRDKVRGYVNKHRGKPEYLLSPAYIKDAIINGIAYQHHIRISRRDISSEDIKLYREGLEAKRLFRNFLKEEKHES
jgi:hypothetical protein